MVARTLPGKQFEVGRQLRALVVSALRRADIATSGAVPSADPEAVMDGLAVARQPPVAGHQVAGTVGGSS